MTRAPAYHKIFKYSIDADIYTAFVFVCNEVAGNRSQSFVIRNLIQEFVAEHIDKLPVDERGKISDLIEKYRGS